MSCCHAVSMLTLQLHSLWSGLKYDSEIDFDYNENLQNEDAISVAVFVLNVVIVMPLVILMYLFIVCKLDRAC